MSTPRWMYLVHLHNSILDNNHSEIEAIVKMIHKATAYRSYTNKEWKRVVAVCDIKFDYENYCDHFKYIKHQHNVIIEKHKDVKTLVLVEKAKLTVHKSHIITALCRLREYELLLQMIEKRQLSVCYSGLKFKTILGTILMTHEALDDQEMQAALKWYKLATKDSTRHGLMCGGMSAHMFKTAYMALFHQRHDVFAFLAEHCELFKYHPYSPWTKCSSLLYQAIRFDSIKSVDVMLAQGYKLYSYRVNFAHHCAKYGLYGMLDHLLGKGLKIKRLDFYLRHITEMKDGGWSVCLGDILKKHGYKVPWDIFYPSNSISVKRFKNAY